MGVIIDGQERKSVAEQVEENSKYKGKLLGGRDLKIYKKDLPCFVRVIGLDIDDSPIRIEKGSGGTLKELDTDRRKVDYIIIPYNSTGAHIYEVSGNTLIGSYTNYGQNDLVLSAWGGYEWYSMVIPLEYKD